MTRQLRHHLQVLHMVEMLHTADMLQVFHMVGMLYMTDMLQAFGDDGLEKICRILLRHGESSKSLRDEFNELRQDMNTCLFRILRDAYPKAHMQVQLRRAASTSAARRGTL